MNIKFLRLRQFRNYLEQDLNLHPRVNLFIGLNGQGKSNLIEAIEFVLGGDGFRAGQNIDFIMHNQIQEAANVTAFGQVNNIDKKIEIRLSKSRKEYFINDKKCSRESIRKHHLPVIFSPESLGVVKQGPNARRQLLDDLIRSSSPEKIHLITDYSKCLKSKNKLLKEVQEGRLNAAEQSDVIESLNQQLLPLAAELSNARIQCIKNIISRVKKALGTILKDELVDISVDYVISNKSAIDWSENQVYDALKSRLRDLATAELSSGQSLVGPHKHDVQFKYNGQDARYFCSQGQQRAIALAFKIAQIFRHHEMHGYYPTLLLDDVFSELDDEKSESLLRMLSDTPAQIFITTTERDSNLRFQKEEVKVFEVKNGKVQTGS